MSGEVLGGVERGEANRALDTIWVTKCVNEPSLKHIGIGFAVKMIFEPVEDGVSGAGHFKTNGIDPGESFMVIVCSLFINAGFIYGYWLCPIIFEFLLLFNLCKLDRWPHPQFIGLDSWLVFNLDADFIFDFDDVFSLDLVRESSHILTEVILNVQALSFDRHFSSMLVLHPVHFVILIVVSFDEIFNLRIGVILDELHKVKLLHLISWLNFRRLKFGF